MNEKIKKLVKIQKEALNAHFEKGGRSSIFLHVGSGKSKIALNVIDLLNDKFYNLKVIFFGERQIYIDNFLMEIVKFEKEYLINNIDFTCIDSLHNYENNLYNLCVFDECHLSTQAGVDFLNQMILNNPQVDILCLSGTPKKRQQSFKDLLKIAPVSYEKVIDTGVEEGLINDYEINVIKISLSTVENIQVKTKKYSFKTSEQKTYNNLYNKYINRPPSNLFPFELSLLKKFLKNTDNKVLAVKELIKTINYKKLLIYAGSIEQTTKFNYLSYHSKLHKDKNKENYTAFYKGEVNELVNVNSLKESVSIPDLDTGIIMSIEASESSLNQTVGRFCRLLPGEEVGKIYVILFKDTIEEEWFNKASSKLDPSKINYLN